MNTAIITQEKIDLVWTEYSRHIKPYFSEESVAHAKKIWKKETRKLPGQKISQDYLSSIAETVVTEISKHRKLENQRDTRKHIAAREKGTYSFL